MLWEPADGQAVRCKLCGHRCMIQPGQTGVCRVRRNEDGKLVSLNFGKLVALNVDPIEKKPLFHFLPGSKSVSVACAGCNFQCEFCQNWRISQSPLEGPVEGQAVSPEQIVSAAINYDAASISYTYTEPTIFFEMAYETSRLARGKGIRNCFVTNGFFTEEAVERIAPTLDAANVDLKAFRDETYRRVMNARLEPVLACMRALVRAGIWLEVTTLVVPGLNDSEQELGDIARFIADDLGTEVPWHVSRFHADYKDHDTPTTPIETLEKACELGKQAGLKHVYSGNVSGQADESTYCSSCGRTLIDRYGFSVRKVSLEDGQCPDCQTPLAGVFE